jgi:hypothetical protein
MPIDPAMKLKSCATATMGVRPDLALGHQHRVFLAAGLLRGLEPVGVFLLVAEMQRVGHRLGHLHLGEDAAVEQRLRTVRAG